MSLRHKYHNHAEIYSMKDFDNGWFLFVLSLGFHCASDLYSCNRGWSNRHPKEIAEKRHHIHITIKNIVLVLVCLCVYTFTLGQFISIDILLFITHCSFYCLVLRCDVMTNCMCMALTKPLNECSSVNYERYFTYSWETQHTNWFRRVIVFSLSSTLAKIFSSSL